MGALGMHCIKDALKDCHLRAFTSGFLKKISFYILKATLSILIHNFTTHPISHFLFITNSQILFIIL